MYVGYLEKKLQLCHPIRESVSFQASISGLPLKRAVKSKEIVIL
jgi:hypothetical protein